MSFESFPSSHSVERPIERTPKIERAFSSRFGDTEMYEDALENLPVVDLGLLTEVLGVDPHTNEARFVHVQKQGENLNAAHLVEIKDGPGRIYGIFKPESGESIEARENLGYGNFFAREAISYRISNRLGFDVVPPTVVRNINGRIGSLQLYMPQSEYETVQRIEKLAGANWQDLLVDNDDFGKIALFDFITAQVDRHRNNIMARAMPEILSEEEVHNNHELVAIDNGFSFSQLSYDKVESIHGPHISLTTPRMENGDWRGTYSGKSCREHVFHDIPDHELELLRSAREKFSSVEISDLQEYINPMEIRAAKDRLEDLIKTRVYLSRFNYLSALGY